FVRATCRHPMMDEKTTWTQRRVRLMPGDESSVRRLTKPNTLQDVHGWRGGRAGNVQRAADALNRLDRDRCACRTGAGQVWSRFSSGRNRCDSLATASLVRRSWDRLRVTIILLLPYRAAGTTRSVLQGKPSSVWSRLGTAPAWRKSQEQGNGQAQHLHWD